MSKQRGFTLIELVIVIAVLGILAAIAVPKFVALQDDALVAAKKGMSGAVKSAHAVAIADKKAFPKVSELSDYVNGDGVAAVGSGISVAIDGTSYVVPTFKDAKCTAGQETSLVGDEVQCVKNIP
ncbi:MAG: type II secretion system protein [Halobacteria archaeon]|nr:type II secretion system protein [Halobacteria archaeon]